MRDQGEQRAEGQGDESVILFAHSFPKAGQSPLFRPLTFTFFSQPNLHFSSFLHLLSEQLETSYVIHIVVYIKQIKLSPYI